MNNKMMTLSLAVALGLALGSGAHAGNNPNSTRILTGGIGSGTTHGRIPSSHPATSSRAAEHRNSHAADYLAKYRNGLTHRPAASSGSSTLASSSRPTTIPAALPEQALGHAPQSIGGQSGGMSPGTMPSSTPPTTIPATIPAQAQSYVPPVIGHTSGAGFTTGNTPPVTIPAAIPVAAQGRVPDAIGRP